jgi:hypothetical protein
MTGSSRVGFFAGGLAFAFVTLGSDGLALPFVALTDFAGVSAFAGFAAGPFFGAGRADAVRFEGFAKT